MKANRRLTPPDKPGQALRKTRENGRSTYNDLKNSKE